MNGRGWNEAFLIAAEPADGSRPCQWSRASGVIVPDQIQTAGGDALLLNGAGVRKKFFIKVYVGALYLPHKTGEAAVVIAMPSGEQVLMHCVNDEVLAKKMIT